MKKILVLLFLSFSFSTLTAFQEIRIPYRADAWDTRTEYYIGLLKIALEKTRDEYGDYEIVYSKKTLLMDSLSNLLSNHKNINLTWLVTSKEREESLRPIRVPLLKGLIGMRVGIIHLDDAEMFKSVNSLNDLKDFRPIQGLGWADSDILKYNGIDVIQFPVFSQIFKLVAAKKVDYFPRSIHEAYHELEDRKRMNLLVDDNILIRYPAASYFFVTKDEVTLGDRIQKGLFLAIEDGSFDEYFYNFHAIKYIFDNKKMENRVVIDLDNPYLPEATPLNDKRLWHYP